MDEPPEFVKNRFDLLENEHTNITSKADIIMGRANTLPLSSFSYGYIYSIRGRDVTILQNKKSIVEYSSSFVINVDKFYHREGLEAEPIAAFKLVLIISGKLYLLYYCSCRN